MFWYEASFWHDIDRLFQYLFDAGVSQNKQWKPKSNQKSNNPGVIGTPKKSRAPPTDNSVNLESEIVKPQDTHLHVSISESQNVIIADDIRVPKTDRYQLSFGSFVMDFDPSKNSESGFEEACSSQELKRGDINDSLPTPPLKASTNGASDTKTGESFDSQVRNSRAGSPPPVLMASEQQLSEQKDAPGSQSLDEYAQIEFISGNSPPYTALEPKQQQDPLELHSFSVSLLCLGSVCMLKCGENNSNDRSRIYVIYCFSSALLLVS